MYLRFQEGWEYNDLECTRLWRQWTDFAFSLQSYPTGESIADVLLHTLCWGNNTALKRLALGEYRKNFEAWLKILQSSNPLEAVAKDLYEDEMAYSYTHRAEFLIWGRFLSTTVNSHLALVPISASADDQIVVLSGGKIPFVLRATGNTFKIIGPVMCMVSWMERLFQKRKLRKTWNGLLFAEQRHPSHRV